MKVLLINKYLYLRGGAEICALRTGQLLSRHGHEVCLWGMSHPLNQPLPHQDTFITHIDFNGTLTITEKVKAGLRILYSFEARTRLERLLKQWKPDIVHLHNIAHQISPSILSVLEGNHIPVVMTMHDYKLVCPTYLLHVNNQVCERCRGGQYFHCLKQKCTKGSGLKSMVNMLEMYLHHSIMNLYQPISTFLAVSHFMKSKVEDMGFRRPVKVLRNFLDLSAFEPDYESGDRSVIYFGRLSHEKGLITLVDAMKDTDLKLKIVGDGPMKEQVIGKIRGEGIQNVSLLGFKSGQDLHDEIRKSMFSIIPSEWYETFGYTIIESFALGKPVVGSRIGAIPELMEGGGTGFLFEPGNTVDLRERILSLAGQPDLIKDMGRQARQYVEEHFQAEEHYQRLLEIYHCAMSKEA